MEESLKRFGIWLEVAEARYQSGVGTGCSVQLKGDREQPKPAWWPVDLKALGKDDFETYKALLHEIDKKRLVLARLACSTKMKEDGTYDHWLHCDAFRFQSPELGGR